MDGLIVERAGEIASTTRLERRRHNEGIISLRGGSGKRRSILEIVGIAAERLGIRYIYSLCIIHAISFLESLSLSLSGWWLTVNEMAACVIRRDLSAVNGKKAR